MLLRRSACCPITGSLNWYCHHCSWRHAAEVCQKTGKTPSESGYSREMEEYEREHAQ
ncbi:MAG: hypothetical protein LBE99_03040 [Puniceicoccales bacterium]|nr:hypothetical protein [Puniceicoccales bacterium]